MKICSICNKSKSLDQFNKQTSKNDGLDPRCRSCCIEQKNKQRRTPEGVANTLYDTQVRNCKSRGYTLPQYTKKEFREWLLKNPIFNSLYTDWVNANYEKDLKPSVDRLNDYKSYSFDNIQIIT